MAHVSNSIFGTELNMSTSRRLPTTFLSERHLVLLQLWKRHPQFSDVSWQCGAPPTHTTNVLWRRSWIAGKKRRNQTFYFGVMSKLTFLRIISTPLWRIQCPALVKRNEHHTGRTLGTSFELIQNVGSGSHLIAWHILLLFLPIFPLPSSGGTKKNHQGEEGGLSWDTSN